jgi:uncharacterized protein GlcG (DUF336 family)
MKISYSLARILGDVAETHAEAVGVPMAVALADAEGGLLFFSRMDGTLPASTEIAVSKAYTSAILRMSTEELGRLARPGEVLYGIQHTHNGRIVLFGGGLPLRLGGQVVGGIGVSGGTVEQDILVAKPVAEALEQMECWSEHLKGLLPSKPLGGSWAYRLESRLRELLEDMDCHLPGLTASILSGAMVMADLQRFCASGT